MTLVLAIDATGSIRDDEYALQLAASAGAILDPQVIQAMAEIGGVAVGAVIWADSAVAVQTLDFVRISDHESAHRFATMLASQPRLVSGNTDRGYGISAALDLVADPNNCASYNVIDVSGDGPNIGGRPLADARGEALDKGFTINALAIRRPGGRPGGPNGQPLEDYYRDAVIGGPGAFVEVADETRPFALAARRKLLIEIAGTVPPARYAAGSDRR
jgi:hypothetical protein